MPVNHQFVCLTVVGHRIWKVPPNSIAKFPRALTGVILLAEYQVQHVGVMKNCERMILSILCKFETQVASESSLSLKKIKSAKSKRERDKIIANFTSPFGE